MSVTDEATVTSKGQITIPKEIRDRMDLTQGETVAFEVTEKGEVMMRKSDNPLEELRDLREEITFSETDIETMKRESKRQWSKFE